jgi:hypothetical protein
MNKTKTLTTAIILVLVFNLGACEFNKMSHVSSPVIVKIPWKEKGQDHYSLQSVELKTIKQLSPLEGEAANLYVRPEIHENYISGNFFEIKYTYTSKKEVIPLNRLSSQALTLYAHMERLYLWSSTLNLPQDLKTKLDVGLAAEFIDGGAPMRNNALFSSLLNSMLVVPYSGDSMPLSLNGGVLAHEYFHFLFNGLVLKHLIGDEKLVGSAIQSPHDDMNWLAGTLFDFSRLRYQKSNLNSENCSCRGAQAPLYYENPSADFHNKSDKSDKESAEWFVFAFIRGMNEGLADIWGWLYSEDSNFIVPSLPIVEKMRDLEAKPKVIWTKSQMISAIVTKAKQGEAAEALAYDLGTQYARWAYKRIVEVEGGPHLSDERRNLWSNRIIERLVNYANKSIDLKNLDKMVPSEFIAYLLFGEESLSEEECSSWASFVEKSERRAAFSKNCAAGLFTN